MATHPPLRALVRVGAALAATLAFGCATSARIELERVRGAYSTHFDGIPDSAAICAVIHNRGPAAVDWVRLRLRAESEWEGIHSRTKSYWLVEERIEPGASLVVQLDSPPIANSVALEITGRGTGTARRGGRPVERADGCSEGWLADRIDRDAVARGAPDVAYVAIETGTSAGR